MADRSEEIRARKSQRLDKVTDGEKRHSRTAERYQGLLKGWKLEQKMGSVAYWRKYATPPLEFDVEE
jgi:hypothetical protein